MAGRIALWVTAGWLAVAAALTAQAETPANAAQPRIVVVLDSSANMLNPLENFKKYYLVRKTLKDQLVAPLAGHSVGLIAYGHRTRSTCNDVELLRPVEPFDATRFLRTAFSVRPNGQSMVSEALKAAAAALGPGGGKVLLIAGASDSCQQDPCAAAKALADAEPGLAIDVLALGVSETDGKQMQCIADAGRGREFAAATIADTPKAFADAFASLAMPPAVILPPTPQVSTTAAGGLNLSARLGESGAAFDQPLAWTVRPIEGGKPGQVVFRADAAAATAPVPAGTYDVEVAANGLDVHQKAEVVIDKVTDLVVALNAGSVRLRSSAAKPDAASGGVFYTIYRTTNDPEDDTPDTTIAILRDPVASPLLLPAGTYRIVANRGGMRLERTLDLATGDVKATDFALATGTLQIEADAATDPKRSPAIYFVSEDDPDQPLGRRDVAQSTLPNPSFELPPGLYHVSTRQGAGKARLDAVVKAGEVTRLAVPVSMGRLRLETQGLPDGPDLPEDLISYTVERLDEAGQTQSIAARSSDSVAGIELEAGQYRVTGRVGLANIAATTDVMVKAAVETSTVLRQDVGLIDLGYGDVPAAAVDVLWEIRGSDGKVVWSTTAAHPLVPLAPGGYTIRVLRLGKEQSVDVVLAAGERKTVAIRPE